MVKLIVTYGHPVDPEAFEKYYAETHAPIAARIKGPVKAEFTKLIGTPDGGKPESYRLAELWFESVDDLQAAMASDEGQATVADLANFATGGVTVAIGEVG